MLTDLPSRIVSPAEGLSSRVATEHIYHPFGSDDPNYLAYAPGDRVAETDIAAIEAAGYFLPAWGNHPPDEIRRMIEEVANMDVAERRAYEAYPDRYADLAEDAPSTIEVVDDSKEKMESGEIADTRISGVGTDPEFKRDNAGTPAELNDDVDMGAREAALAAADEAATNPTEGEPGPADQSAEASDEKAVEKDSTSDKAVTRTRRKPASK